MIQYDPTIFDEPPKIKIVSIGNEANDIVKHICSQRLKSIESIALASKPCTSRDNILASLNGCDMTFIITAENATDVSTAVTVAECARDVGALTLGVVIKPIQFGLTDWQSNQAKEIEEFQEKIDSIFAFPKEQIYHFMKNILDLTTTSGIINLDLTDMKYIFGNVGYAVMGHGTSSGENAYEGAVREALRSMPSQAEIESAGSILVNITGVIDFHDMLDGNKTDATLYESVHSDANIICISSSNEALSDDISVTVYATRLGDLDVDVV